MCFVFVCEESRVWQKIGFRNTEAFSVGNGEKSFGVYGNQRNTPTDHLLTVYSTFKR